MNRRCFIVGLPGAGKTTFLAALWHSINNNSVETKLKLNKIDNGQYLAQLSRKWVDAEPLDRTVPSNEQKDICINLIMPTRKTFDLFLPDLSGETFQKQYEQREISEELVEYIKAADAILFFIHVDGVKSLGFIPEHFTNSTENNSVQRLVREPQKHDPLQVQTIELLQFILDLRKYEKTNVGFVFSAWDLAKQIDNEMTPENFLFAHMNMLWQFCNSNSDILHYSLWGISGQGGKLDDRDTLLEKDFPIERIVVEDTNGNKGWDITLPLYSLMGEIE
jgi:GTPase SAR1 family protein